MRKKVLLVLTLLVMSVALFVGCSQNPAVLTIKPGETFTIGVGQSAQIFNEGMTVTFNEVIGDSRAPEGVNAIWEGVANIGITIRYDGTDYSIVLLQAGRTEQATYTFIDYTLVYSLNPYPVADKEIPSKDYRLTMTVTKSGAPIVDNRATIRGEVNKVTKLATGGWQVEVLLQQVNNVSELPNPVSDKLGQVVNLRTDEDTGNLKTGQVITGTVRLTGDVERGVYLYLSDIVQ